MSLKKSVIDKIKKSVDESRYADAFAVLSETLSKKNLPGLRRELNSLKETYSYMIDYLLKGYEDNTREKIYAGIGESLCRIADKIEREDKAIDSSDSYSSALRMIRLRDKSWDELVGRYNEIILNLSDGLEAGVKDPELEKERSALLVEIFNYIWTSFDDTSLYRRLPSLVLSSLEGSRLPEVIISALSLSLLSYYDDKKLEALAEIYENSESEPIAARSLVGIVFALDLHRERIRENSPIRTRLSLWQDSIITYRRLREVIKTIIRTRDTDRVSTKMREEVIPELMKLQPDILKNMNTNPDDMLAADIDNNPEWEEMLEKSGLAKKMQELSEMQSEGADLMMVAFSNLKQFDFFNTVANWFIPFYASNPALSLSDNEKRLLDLFDSTRNVCDSDKYSLALAFARMPENQKRMMMSQLDAQMAQISEDVKTMMAKSSTPEFDMETTGVVRDLYRFFKLYRNRSDFRDPFSGPLRFLSIPIVGEMMSDREIIRVIGEFYFKRGYYAEALDMFLALEDGDESADQTYWEKIGFCYENLKFYDRALESYTKAELLKTPGLWLLKKLAFINRQTGQYDVAAGYYERVLEKEPENVKMLLSCSNCYLKSGNLPGALQNYYHVLYLNPEDKGALRAAAWAELKSGNLDKSSSMFDKLLSDKPEYIDFLNAGHLKMALKKYNEAVELYVKAARLRPDIFEEDFVYDADDWTNLGLSSNIFNIIRDDVKFRLQEK